MKRARARSRASAAFVDALTRIAAQLHRAQHSLACFSEAFAAHAIDLEDLSELTVRQYARIPGSSAGGLSAWERGWFARDLPQPPAKLLVGGCGWGREVHALVARGYDVHAFDPARECVDICGSELPDPSAVAQLSYEDLSADPEARKPAARALHMAAPFDAVLLGCGSFSHVLDERDQDRLFETLARLSPRGSILASFMIERIPRPTGRAAALGVAVAKRLRLDRAEAGAAQMRERVICEPRIGFAYLFDRARLERLAQIAGRTLTLYDSAEYPHATFVV